MCWPCYEPPCSYRMLLTAWGGVKGAEETLAPFQGSMVRKASELGPGSRGFVLETHFGTDDQTTWVWSIAQQFQFYQIELRILQILHILRQTHVTTFMVRSRPTQKRHHSAPPCELRLWQKGRKGWGGKGGKKIFQEHPEVVGLVGFFV